MFIYLQEYYGPRFFLPKFFFPQTFDYFTNLPDLDLEMCSEPNEDCVICLNSLHQSPNVQNGSSETSNLNNNNGRTHPYLLRLSSQKQVMQAPCQHKFHSLCLLNWMMIKMECPTCRHPLPPV